MDCVGRLISIQSKSRQEFLRCEEFRDIDASTAGTMAVWYAGQRD